MKEEKNFKNSMFKAAKSLVNTLPIIFGTILLFSLIITIIPKSFYLSIFKNSIFFLHIVNLFFYHFFEFFFHIDIQSLPFALSLSSKFFQKIP